MMFMPMFSPVRDVSPAGVTLTAGAGPSPNTGYGAPPLFPPTFGSLSAQPYDGLTVTVLSTDGWGLSLIFDGDVAATVASLTLYVDDVAYPLSRDYPPEYFGPDYGTEAYWDDVDPFIEGHFYTIRIE